MTTRQVLPEHDYRSVLSEQWLFKLGSLLFLLGGVTGAAAGILHPHADPNSTDPEAFVSLISGSAIWTWIHVASLVGFLFTLGGFVALYRSLGTQPERGLARLGLTFAIVASAAGLVLLAIEGIAFKQVADAWAAAQGTDRQIFFVVAGALEEVSLALFSVTVLTYYGLPFVAFGLAVIYSDGYPSWFGWIAVVSGGACVLLGLAQLFTGEHALITGILIPIASNISAIWLVPISILLIRRSTALAEISMSERVVPRAPTST